MKFNENYRLDREYKQASAVRCNESDERNIHKGTL